VFVGILVLFVFVKFFLVVDFFFLFKFQTHRFSFAFFIC
jgi:hypothetical protein